MVKRPSLSEVSVTNITRAPLSPDGLLGELRRWGWWWIVSSRTLRALSAIWGLIPPVRRKHEREMRRLLGDVLVAADEFDEHQKWERLKLLAGEPNEYIPTAAEQRAFAPPL